jgi:hypothetical protein
VFEHLRRLARLRSELPALRHGSLLHLHDEEQQTVFARTLGAQTVLIAFNNDTRPATFEFDATETGLPNGTRLDDRLDIIKTDTVVTGGKVTFSLPARSAALLTARE